MERSQSILGLATITGICIAGLIRLPWWSACAGACLLMLISLTMHRVEYARFSQINDTVGQSSLLLSGALNAAVAAAVAFGLGRGIGWLWGV
jgi:hypothetical protein